MSKGRGFNPSRVLNINVGVLGHVDCGKTSLVKALSTVLSTAALDKHPQSRQRGITLDLGFSAFMVPMPDHLQSKEYDVLQFTLVDCPGHASLIRTIIGGAQIIDIMLLVIDVNKGVQAQTLECVVIGEAVMESTTDIIIVLNKVDLIPEEDRTERVKHAEHEISTFLMDTKFHGASFVSCAAAVGGEKTASLLPRVASAPDGQCRQGGDSATAGVRARGPVPGGKFKDQSRPKNLLPNPVHGAQIAVKPEAEDTHKIVEYDLNKTSKIEDVVEMLKAKARLPKAVPGSPFYFGFDHCFSVQGQGTVLTGTVLGGEVKVNQMVELPALGIQKRVKSMQMFHQPITKARSGDRLGMCLAGLDAKLLERGVAATPGTVRKATSALAVVEKVWAYEGQCLSGAYCHVTLGHVTVRASATFFGAKEIAQGWSGLINHSNLAEGLSGVSTPLSLEDVSDHPFPWDADFAQQSELVGVGGLPNVIGRVQPFSNLTKSKVEESPLQYCLLSFQKPVLCPPHSVVLGSRLDSLGGSAKVHPPLKGVESDGSDPTCRIAFRGRLLRGLGTNASEGNMPPCLGLGKGDRQVKVYTEKEKAAIIFRVGQPVIGSSGKGKGRPTEVFGKDLFKKETNMAPFIGMILQTKDGEFGRLVSSFGQAGKFKAYFPQGTNAEVGDKLILRYRRYTNDPSKAMNQDHIQKIAHAALVPTEALEPTGNNDGIGIRDDRREGDRATELQQLAESDTEGGSRSRANEGERPVKVRLAVQDRVGCIDSLKDNKLDQERSRLAIISGLFAQEEDIREMAKRGVEVLTVAGERGWLLGPFGKAGKCKVEFPDGIRSNVGTQVFAKMK